MLQKRNKRTRNNCSQIQWTKLVVNTIKKEKHKKQIGMLNTHQSLLKVIRQPQKNMEEKDYFSLDYTFFWERSHGKSHGSPWLKMSQEIAKTESLNRTTLNAALGSKELRIQSIKAKAKLEFWIFKKGF